MVRDSDGELNLKMILNQKLVNSDFYLEGCQGRIWNVALFEEDLDD